MASLYFVALMGGVGEEVGDQMVEMSMLGPVSFPLVILALEQQEDQLLFYLPRITFRPFYFHTFSAV